MIAWSTIKPALVTLMSSLAVDQITPDEDDAQLHPPFEAEWAERRKTHVHPEHSQALYLKVLSVASKGVDETRFENIEIEDVPDLQATQCGLRRFTLQVQSRCTEYEDNLWCMQTLERIRTRLRRLSSLAALRAVGCALIRIENAVDISFRSDQHIWSAGNLDVILACEVNDVDPIPVGFIERIELTSHWQNNGVDISTPPNVSADTIPELPP